MRVLRVDADRFGRSEDLHIPVDLARVEFQAQPAERGAFARRRGDPDAIAVDARGGPSQPFDRHFPNDSALFAPADGKAGLFRAALAVWTAKLRPIAGTRRADVRSGKFHEDQQ